MCVLLNYPKIFSLFFKNAYSDGKRIASGPKSVTLRILGGMTHAAAEGHMIAALPLRPALSSMATEELMLGDDDEDENGDILGDDAR